MTSIDLDKSSTADVDALRAWMRDELPSCKLASTLKTAAST